jgi:hypothetical protein
MDANVHLPALVEALLDPFTVKSNSQVRRLSTDQKKMNRRFSYFCLLFVGTVCGSTGRLRGGFVSTASRYPHLFLSSGLHSDSVLTQPVVCVATGPEFPYLMPLLDMTLLHNLPPADGTRPCGRWSLVV